MDEYILHNDNDRANDYYRIMGGLAARALSEEAIMASRYIKNSRIKNDFRNNIFLFIESQKDVLDGDSSPDQKRQALTYLNQEKSYLSSQIFKIKYEGYLTVLSISIDILDQYLETPLFYLIKGVGVASGTLQVVTGVGLIGGSYATGPGAIAGNIAGVALVVHGAGAIQDNLWAIKTGNRNYKGYLRRVYESAAENLGFTSSQGDIVYGGIDLALSFYTLGRSVILPDKWRLFHYMYNDTYFGFQEMAKTKALTIEIGIDGLTIKSIIDSTSPSVTKIPFPFPSNPDSP